MQPEHKKGVIRCPDIKCSDEEILEGLKDEGVIKLDTISGFRDGQRKPTGTFILTFQSQTLPKYIRVGCYRVAVSQLIPNPIRCYKCQKFGHTKFNCRKNEVCNKCGKEDHTDSQECTKEAKCVNCQGNHASNDKTCPKWKEEKEIQRIKAERGISNTDAKKQMDIFNSAKAAAATKPVVKTVNAETQTEMTWPEGTKQPKKCAVEKQINKVNKTSASSQTSASQNDPIKLKISQSKVYLTKQQKGSNDPITQYNKYDVLSDSDSDMSVEESPITKSQGRSDNKKVNYGTKQNKSILQWNCRDFNLIFNFRPYILALQETHFKDSDNVHIRGFDHYFKTCMSEVDGRATGGCFIFVKNGIPHEVLELDTELQAVAVKVSLHKTITVCNVYIPPRFNVAQSDLVNLVNQLPAPFLFIGDFNAHSDLWGCSSCNSLCNKVEHLLESSNICLLNDKSRTYFHHASGSFTSIDLSLCSASVFLDFTWQVHSDECGSDHFPILLNIVKSMPKDNVPRWNLKKADWPKSSVFSRC